MRIRKHKLKKKLNSDDVFVPDEGDIPGGKDEVPVNPSEPGAAEISQNLNFMGTTLKAMSPLVEKEGYGVQFTETKEITGLTRLPVAIEHNGKTYTDLSTEQSLTFPTLTLKLGETVSIKLIEEGETVYKIAVNRSYSAETSEYGKEFTIDNLVVSLKIKF